MMRWDAKLKIIIILMWATIPFMSYLDVHLLASPATSWLVEVPLPEGMSAELVAYMGSLSSHISKVMFFSAGVLLALWLQRRGGEGK